MKRTAFAFAFAILSTAVSLPVAAQAPTCVKRTDLIQHLANQYHETPVAVGIADNGALLEVFVSTEGETWTVAVTLPSGVTCLIATGQQWQDLPHVAVLDQPT